MQPPSSTASSSRSKSISVCLCLTAAIVLPLSIHAQDSISISLNPSKARSTAIPSDFEGISYEMSLTAKAYNGTNWLTGTPTGYSKMLERIGIKSIRVGGNSAEDSTYPVNADAADVNDFTNMIGANLIWTLPVWDEHYNNTTYSNFAKTMYQDKTNKHYGFTTTFEIGNEPDGEIPNSTYQSRFDLYNSTLRSEVATTNITTGPSSGGGSTTLSNNLANDSTYAGSLHSSIEYITSHNYPAGCADHISSAADAISDMLSPSVDTTIANYYNSFSADPIAKGFKFRIEETNSICEAGTEGASNAYASALFMADYMCYEAYNTALAGMNIHTGGSNAFYNVISPVGYASSYTLNPAGYGMFAFAYNGQGQPVPVSITNSRNINVTAYALLESNGSESTHIINRTYGSSAVDLTVKVSPGNSYSHAQVMYLKQTNDDVTATSGVTLGGQPVNSDGSWTGGYTLDLTPQSGVFDVPVPHAQLAIVHMYN